MPERCDQFFELPRRYKVGQLNSEAAMPNFRLTGSIFRSAIHRIMKRSDGSDAVR